MVRFVTTTAHNVIDVPRPFLDTISNTSQALSVFALSITRPAREEVLVLLLNANRIGIGLISTGLIGTALLSTALTGSQVSADSLNSPTESGHILGHHVVGVASQHPDARGCYVLTCEANTTPSPDDAERWFAFNDVCDRAGLVLIDWSIRGFSSLPGQLPGRGALWCPKHVAGLG